MSRCKFIIKKKYNSSAYTVYFDNTVDRRCKNDSVIDGLCTIHHKMKVTCLCGNRIKDLELGVCDECK